MNTFSRHTTKGFTLIEMLVAVALFSIVMLIGMSALLTLIDQNRQTQALNSVMRDINFSLESVVRTIRTGNNYGCGGSIGQDCENGDTEFVLTNQDGEEVEYRFRVVEGTGRVERSVEDGSYVALTSENVDIEEFTFYVFGAEDFTTGDEVQPRVLIAISGTSLLEGAPLVFNMQTTVTQRVIDL